MAETTIGFEPPVVVLDGAIEHPLTDLASYRAVGGYAQLERARAMTPHDVTDQLIQSNLRGRGGAFFPT
jgi:NADH-quinone oxidoreductase subunit F